VSSVKGKVRSIFGFMGHTVSGTTGPNPVVRMEMNGGGRVPIRFRLSTFEFYRVFMYYEIFF